MRHYRKKICYSLLNTHFRRGKNKREYSMRHSDYHDSWEKLKCKDIPASLDLFAHFKLLLNLFDFEQIFILMYAVFFSCILIPVDWIQTPFLSVRRIFIDLLMLQKYTYIHFLPLLAFNDVQVHLIGLTLHRAVVRHSWNNTLQIYWFQSWLFDDGFVILFERWDQLFNFCLFSLVFIVGIIVAEFSGIQTHQERCVRCLCTWLIDRQTGLHANNRACITSAPFDHKYSRICK